MIFSSALCAQAVHCFVEHPKVRCMQLTGANLIKQKNKSLCNDNNECSRMLNAYSLIASKNIIKKSLNIFLTSAPASPPSPNYSGSAGQLGVVHVVLAGPEHLMLFAWIFACDVVTAEYPGPGALAGLHIHYRWRWKVKFYCIKCTQTLMVLWKMDTSAHAHSPHI